MREFIKKEKGELILTNRGGSKIKLYNKKKPRVPVSVRLPVETYLKVDAIHSMLDSPEYSMSNLYIQLINAAADMLFSDNIDVLLFLKKNSADMNVIMAKIIARKAELDRMNSTKKVAL